jgi:competence protein ComEA
LTGPRPTTVPRHPPPAAPKKAESLTAPIDVNRATAEELQKLPGIGPRMAQRILDERAKGPFKSVEELRRVSGIGPKTLDKLRPFVCVQ